MSAKVGKLIYGLLANSTNVASAVGTRIYPNVAPLNAVQTFPYLVYKIITTESTDTKGNLADWDPVLAGPTDRRSPLDIIQIQVSTFGINYNTTADLAHDVRLALDRTVGSGFTAYGIVVDSMIYAGESGLYESDVKPIIILVNLTEQTNM